MTWAVWTSTGGLGRPPGVFGGKFLRRAILLRLDLRRWGFRPWRILRWAPSSLDRAGGI